MRLFYPEWICCLGKVHKPDAQEQGRKNTAAQARMIFPPRSRRGTQSGPARAYLSRRQPAGWQFLFVSAVTSI